jgi:hypothetical protein
LSEEQVQFPAIKGKPPITEFQPVIYSEFNQSWRGKLLPNGKEPEELTATLLSTQKRSKTTTKHELQK